MRGRHSLKFGYRLVDRYASPFTNTDTRGTLNFGRNFTNNPVTNTGGSGLATLLTGYLTGAARGFLLEPYTLRTQEHGLFVQDDFKVSSRFTVNAGLRYEIFKAEEEEDNKVVNYDPVTFRLIYAGEDGASRSVNKKTRYGNFAPRLGLTYDLFGSTIDNPAQRIRDHLLPRATLRVEHDRSAGPVHHLAEREPGDQSD